MQQFCHKVSFILLLFLLATCSSKQFSSQSDTQQSSALPDNKQDSKQEPPPNLNDAEVEGGEDTIANEPVAVGGASLTCQYNAKQRQNEMQFQLQCQLSGLKYQATKVEANFAKLAANGRQFPLEILDFNPDDFSWQLLENPLTVFFPKIRAEITIDDYGPFIFMADIKQNLAIEIFDGYWLAGEPNNEGNNEDCVELYNRAAQNNHLISSGLSSGELERLNDVSCNSQRAFLCRNLAAGELADKWLLSAEIAMFAAYPTACPEGYRFALPLSDVELMEVNALIDQQEAAIAVWVPMRRKLDEPSLFEVLME